MLRGQGKKNSQNKSVGQISKKKNNFNMYIAYIAIKLRAWKGRQ